MVIGLFTCFLHLYLSEVQSKLPGVNKQQLHQEKGGPRRPSWEDADAGEGFTHTSHTCLPTGHTCSWGAAGGHRCSQLEGSWCAAAGPSLPADGGPGVQEPESLPGPSHTGQQLASLSTFRHQAVSQALEA